MGVRVRYSALLLLALLGLTGLFHEFVVTPLDYANKDFMSFWTGGKAILRSVSPYDAEAWNPLRAEFGSGWFPEPIGLYPLWTYMLMVPLALLDVPLAAAVWLAVSAVAFGLSLFVLVRLFAVRPLSPLEVGLLLFVAGTSIAGLLVFVNGQVSFMLLAVVAGYLYGVRRGWFFPAGFLLSTLLIKPNVFVIFLPFLGVWLLWRKRWRTVAGGLTGGLVWLGASLAVDPLWLGDWFSARSQTVYVTITPTVWGLSATLFGEWWLPAGFIFSIILVGGVAYYVFVRLPNLSDEQVVSLLLVLTLATTPYLRMYEYVLLFVPWLYIWLRNSAGKWLFFITAWLLPSLLFGLAVVRVNNSLMGLVLLLVLATLLWLFGRGRYAEIRAN